ncbi:MAG: ASCH domain-containing protein [Actinomycetaceae bacterium]|nr:ASCH domain-containing protein [Actinomycetaceae bacterium]
MTENLPKLEETPIGEYAFPGALRDALVGAILDGRKTSTTSLFAEFDFDKSKIEGVGTREAVVDSHGNIVCVTVNRKVEIIPLKDVTLEHAINEGEGFTTLEEWRDAHVSFWRSQEFVDYMGEVDLSDDALVVCHTFEIDEHYPVELLVPWEKNS